MQRNGSMARRLAPQVRVRVLDASCPRCALVFWTLTWAEEASGRPTEHSGVRYTMYIYRRGAFLWQPAWFISGWTKR